MYVLCFHYFLQNEIYLTTESWFWSFNEGMNGITDAHIVCARRLFARRLFHSYLH